MFALDLVLEASIEAVFCCGGLCLRTDAHHAYVVAWGRMSPLSLLAVVVSEELGLVRPARVASGLKPRPVGVVSRLAVSLAVTLSPLPMPQHLAGGVASGVVSTSTFWALGPKTYVWLDFLYLFLLRFKWCLVCHLVLLRLSQLLRQGPCELKMRMVALKSLQHLDRLSHEMLLSCCLYGLQPLSLYLNRQVSLSALLLKLLFSSPLVLLSLPSCLLLHFSRLSQFLLDLLVSLNLTHLGF